MDMENRFEFCCSDFDVVRSTSECDRLTCDGKHNPVFTIFFQKSSNDYCYCLMFSWDNNGDVFAKIKK